MQALVLDTYAPDNVLKVDEQSGLEVLTLLEHQYVIMPGQSNLLYSRVLKKTLDGWSNTCKVEPEQETDVTARHL